MAIGTDIPGVGSNITQYSFSAAVPTGDPGDMAGETGSITFSTAPLSYPQLLRNRRFTLTDSVYGAMVGRISDVTWAAKGPVNFTAETMLQRLNIETTVYPSYGVTMTQAMDAALDTAGMHSSGLPTSGTVIFPGWRGTLLDYLKHFCIAYGYEYCADSSDADAVIFRPIRTTNFGVVLSDETFTINDQTNSQSVECSMYEYTAPSSPTANLEFAPFSVDTPQILTVNAGEVVEYDIQCNGWLASVNQPTPMDLVGPEERTDTGAYCVAGNDGLPIMATQWVAQGGSVTVSIADDPSVLHVVIVAPESPSLPNTSGEESLAPYSIAATAVDENTFYNSLHITGKGVRYAKTTQRFLTGAPGEVTMEEVGVSVTNPFVSTPSMLWDVGVRAAQGAAGPDHTLSVTGTSTEGYEAVLGSRYATADAVFRVTGTTVGPSGMVLAAESDTLVSDFNTAWAGKTLADFSAVWAGQTFNVMATLPTKTS